MHLLPKTDDMNRLVLNATRLLVLVTFGGLVLSYYLSPFTIRILGAQYRNGPLKFIIANFIFNITLAYILRFLV